jgi:hypothetical protein
MSKDNDDYYFCVYIKRITKVPKSGTISFVYSTLIRVDSIIYLTIGVEYRKGDCSIFSDPLYHSFS